MQWDALNSEDIDTELFSDTLDENLIESIISESNDNRNGSVERYTISENALAAIPTLLETDICAWVRCMYELIQIGRVLQVYSSLQYFGGISVHSPFYKRGVEHGTNVLVTTFEERKKEIY